ncbi:MAG TPA: YqgE/AlgH family protein [Anaeromyxobacteraceae bacterium]|nr:YqgE/AlgH family protein [Anaeromyxobacteraceae bacterium]
MASERSASHLAPGYLVAAPGLRDPNFAGSLVLMTGHRRDGAMGFVVNRPAPMTVAGMLGAVDAALGGLARSSALAGQPVLVGGPVSPEQVWLLYRRGAAGEDDDAIRVGRRFAVGSSRPVLEAILRGADAGPVQLFVGYAGWAPLQLETEISQGSWVPLGFDEDLVTTVPVADRWATAVRRLGLDPGGFLVGGGGAMA